jgi:RNA polymerase sigma-70 factor (ECF subfamily)
MVSPATPNPANSDSAISGTVAPETDESALVARLKADDESAYEEMVRQFGPRMLSVARRMLPQEQDAQDAVQDAFLSAFKSIDHFQGDAKLATWLHRIVVNASLMKLRSKRRKPESSIDDLLPKYHEDGHRRGNGDWRVTHDTAVQTSEIREQVLKAIDQLPDLYREILLLRDIEELSTDETAQQLEITEGAVKTRLHRARLALRESLDPYMRGEAR